MYFLFDFPDTSELSEKLVSVASHINQFSQQNPFCSKSKSHKPNSLERTDRPETICTLNFFRVGDITRRLIIVTTRHSTPTAEKMNSSQYFVFLLGFYRSSRTFHSFGVDSIDRWGEIGRSPWRKTTRPPASRTLFVARARPEPTAM